MKEEVFDSTKIYRMLYPNVSTRVFGDKKLGEVPFDVEYVSYIRKKGKDDRWYLRKVAHTETFEEPVKEISKIDVSVYKNFLEACLAISHWEFEGEDWILDAYQGAEEERIACVKQAASEGIPVFKYKVTPDSTYPNIKVLFFDKDGVSYIGLESDVLFNHKEQGMMFARFFTCVHENPEYKKKEDLTALISAFNTMLYKNMIFLSLGKEIKEFSNFEYMDQYTARGALRFEKADVSPGLVKKTEILTNTEAIPYFSGL